MNIKTKISPSVSATRPRVFIGASLAGGATCAAAAHRLDGIGMSVDTGDALGVRPTYVPIVQAFPVGERAWSPPA